MKKLLQAVGIILGAYLAMKIIFSYILHEPIPYSVMKMFMFFIVVGVLMAMTADEESTEELFSPMVELIYNPEKKFNRNIVFAILPLLAALLTYQVTKPTLEAPIELRTVHPAPPVSMRVFNKTFNMITLKNPYRELEKSDPEKFRETVQDGWRVYYENCHYCHGDKMMGKGHYAAGFNNPLPANFVDVGTIAQLQESYLFWRIATGGPGLPNEGAPWLSPMPVWQDYLTEDEIWKVILFLYDYTGHAPRVMDMGH